MKVPVVIKFSIVRRGLDTESIYINDEEYATTVDGWSKYSDGDDIAHLVGKTVESIITDDKWSFMPDGLLYFTAVVYLMYGNSDWRRSARFPLATVFFNGKTGEKTVYINPIEN